MSLNLKPPTKSEPVQPVAVPQETKVKVKSDKKPASSGNLMEVLAAIRKEKGDKVIVSGDKIPVVRRLPTGIFEFDFYTGGGFPCGRYSIVYGPESSCKTNICLKAVANAQKLPAPCNKAIWVNVEQSFDPVWAGKMGVDVDNLLVVNAGYGEEAIDLVDALVRAEDVAVLVVDSMAGLIASKEIAQSVENYDIGTSALLIKRMVNKLMIAFCEERKRDHDPCVILINQTRFKPGVMFGDPECLHGDTVVNFVDGSSHPIREVVEKEIAGEVWSFDEHLSEFLPAKIVSFHRNGEAKSGELVTVTAGALDTKNGVSSATVSLTHKFLTEVGWKAASELKVGDLLRTKYTSIVNGTLKEFLIGTACGDMHLAVPNAGGKRALLKIEDSVNPQYLDWKAGLLSPFLALMKKGNDSGGSQYLSSPRSDLYALKESLLFCRHPRALFENFSWLSFALWMMDDGNYYRMRYTLSIGRFKKEADTREYISNQLDALGLHHSWHQDKQVVFEVASSERIAQGIREFVPECMWYKLPEGTGKMGLTGLACKEMIVPAYVPVLKMELASSRKYRDRRYFDIHVEGPNNYMVGNVDNGFVVHNTMPGGEAQKFLSSLRVRVYAKNIIDKPSSTLMFKDTHAVIKKAKVPVRATDFDFKLCVHAQDDLQVGDTDSFNMVKSHLQSLGLLLKEPKGYLLKSPSGDKSYPTITVLQDKYQKDRKFQSMLQAMVIDSYKDNLILVEESDYSPKNVPSGVAVQSIAVDTDTGEIVE